MRRTLPLAFIFILLAACGSTSLPPEKTVTVFAAASLNQAFMELGKNFEMSHAGVKVSFNFAGSQALSAQLLEGAKADILASANHIEMDKLVAAGLVQPDSPRDFASNRLVVILPPKNPAHINSLMDLDRAGLKLDLADVSVPAGKYSRQILESLSKDPGYGADFAQKVLANVTSNETDVEVVVTKVHLGEADAGIVYVSDAVAFPDLKTIPIPSEFNVIARYPFSILKNAPEPGLAAAFRDYVLSAEGQSVLKKWGFQPAMP